MLSCFMKNWSNILVLYICISIFSSGVISAAPEEVKLQSDIVLEQLIKQEPGFDLDKNDMAKFHIWESGIIPYYIDDFSFDKVLRDRIRHFLESTNKITGLSFMEIPTPPTDDSRRWVLFINRKGLLSCADQPFKNFTTQGVQRVLLGYHCLESDEDLANVLLTLVGVPPQHNSPDRDKYINVIKENIIPDKQHLFEKFVDKEWLFHDLGHDFLSAGHYGSYKHTVNGGSTIIAKNNSQPLSYNNRKEKGFSYNDILKIKMLYNFISSNRSALQNKPECKKLFVVNDELSKQSSNPNIEPRPKPLKYGATTQINKNVKKDDNKKVVDEEVDYEKQDNIKLTTDIGQMKQTKDGNKEDDNNINNEQENMDDNNENNDQENREKKDNIQESGGDLNNGSTVPKVEVIKANENEYFESTPKKAKTRNLPLALYINKNKQPLLGQSDYETGDEGKKKYIHEKSK